MEIFKDFLLFLGAFYFAKWVLIAAFAGIEGLAKLEYWWKNR